MEDTSLSVTEDDLFGKLNALQLIERKFQGANLIAAQEEMSALKSKIEAIVNTIIRSGKRISLKTNPKPDQILNLNLNSFINKSNIKAPEDINEGWEFIIAQSFAQKGSDPLFEVGGLAIEFRDLQDDASNGFTPEIVVYGKPGVNSISKSLDNNSTEFIAILHPSEIASLSIV